MIPAAFGEARRPLELTLETPHGRERVEAFILLVANNDYSLEAISDFGARTHLDEGLLHAYVVGTAGRFRLALLFARALTGGAGTGEGYSELVAERLTVGSTRPRIHVAVDGEPAVLPSPLTFELLPRALRVLVPPGAPAAGRAAVSGQPSFEGFPPKTRQPHSGLPRPLRIERRHMTAVQIKRKLRNFPHAELQRRIGTGREA
jgi:YegS C-terminal NAD kinase beta sandwich-like domain